MGLDSLVDLPNWHQADRLIANCRLVALSRYGYTVDWDDLGAALPGVRDRVTQLPMPELEIASHVIQERVAQGMPIRYQVLPPVEEYLRAHQLYENAPSMDDSAG
jgi:nicotinate-nucleotide adenylyltransferase